jgi:hypothetical protein
MPEVIGIPDREDYGDFSKLKPGSLAQLVIQKHNAKVAKLHYDVRLGTPDTGLLSWAVRKGLPEPGIKRLGILQPLHDWEYKDYEGRIKSGYGAGTVKKERDEKVLITNVDKNGVTFVTANEKYPQRFRLQKTDDKNWLLINVTPTEPRGYEKVHYSSVPKEDVAKLFSPDNLVSSKIDGSAAFYEVLGDKMEALSYRNSVKTGRPIVHTERAGLHEKNPDYKGIPKNTVLRGEMYGVRDNEAVSASELGGLLNSTIENSLTSQKDNRVQIKNALFDIYRYGNKDVSNLPYKDRLKLLKQIIKRLPSDKFELPEGYTDPVKQEELWNRITSGEHPITSEGIVATPLNGGVPIKVKPMEEADVIIRDIFPGTGKYGHIAGGFTYALPDNPEVEAGKVGTGLSDTDREDMWLNKDQWIGRTARIRAQEQFPSGAYRAPAFIARHEG